MINNKLLKAFTENANTHAEEIIAAQQAYIIAKAAEDTIKEISEGIQRKILAEGNYQMSNHSWKVEQSRNKDVSRRITDPKDTFKFVDNTEVYHDFLHKCYDEYCKAGIDDPRGWEYIPEAQARDLRLEAENVLLKLAIDILPDDFPNKNIMQDACKHWKYRREILDIILKFRATEKK